MMSHNGSASARVKRKRVRYGPPSEVDVLPSLEVWKSLGESERSAHIAAWNPDSSDGHPLLDEIAADFANEYGQLSGLTITGLGNLHGQTVLGVVHRFVFDLRQLPEYYLGLPVHRSTEHLPDDFAAFETYVWAPENYVRFVERNADSIRAQLGDERMSNDEMLHALIGKPLDAWVETCRAWGPDYTAM